MRIGGMMNEEQLAEMREAEKEMANFEQEMATMSDSERAMMERMMGPRLEMMRSMVAGEGFRTEVLIHEIRVNPDMAFQSTSTVGAPTAILASTSSADTLTGKVQQDLTTLGYEPGEITGEPTTATAIAISKFQAERGMTVTGEASPQLAGILSAEVDKQRSGGVTSANAPATTPTQDPATLRAAQQACLQEKMAAAQKAQKKKRGLGRLMRAVTRTAVQQGNYDIATTTNDVYSASATADDLAAAAEDLGLTEDDVEACKNP
jgi:peptidoglycan hydrolase-like protein with peptidoglycan-binding domain